MSKRRKLKKLDRLRRNTYAFTRQQYDEFAPPRVKSTVSSLTKHGRRGQSKLNIKERSPRGKQQLKQLFGLGVKRALPGLHKFSKKEKK